MKGTVTLLFAVVTLVSAPWALAQTDDVTANTRVAAMVPAGITTRDACIGFQSLSDCTAALHAAQNLNIQFGALKERMAGGLSLSASIHALKPRVDARKEAHRAAAQASEDLRPLG